jgi:hypothetical protein
MKIVMAGLGPAILHIFRRQRTGPLAKNRSRSLATARLFSARVAEQGKNARALKPELYANLLK